MRLPASEPRSVNIPLLVAVAAISAAVIAFFVFKPRPFVLSHWEEAGRPGAALDSAAPATGPSAIRGEAAPVPATALSDYNVGSQLQESVGDGQVEFYRRAVGGGSLLYFVVHLDEQVHVQVVNADGATPGSDAQGDTIWMDGKQHLAPVREMVTAAYSVRPGETLLGAIAFGFHGAVRTSNEGTVVINDVVHRVNPGRAALCIYPDGTAAIGKFSDYDTRQCRQAIGGGPVILLDGKIANPKVATPDGEFVPFNPLGEDFVLIDWRRTVYSGTHPKTAVGVGQSERGQYLVMAVSFGVPGVELARQLRAMGCSDALGGDDDSSTQAVWRGQVVAGGPGRPVPDALAVYVHDGSP